MVIREVTRLIHTNPVAFTTIPDAAQVFDCSILLVYYAYVSSSILLVYR